MCSAWCDLDVTFDLAIVSLTYNILSWLYLRNRSYLVGTWLRGCRCATSWLDLDLTFDLVIVALTYKILSMLYLGNWKVWEVDT